MADVSSASVDSVVELLVVPFVVVPAGITGIPHEESKIAVNVAPIITEIVLEEVNIKVSLNKLKITKKYRRHFMPALRAYQLVFHLVYRLSCGVAPS